MQRIDEKLLGVNQTITKQCRTAEVDIMQSMFWNNDKDITTLRADTWQSIY